MAISVLVADAKAVSRQELVAALQRDRNVDIVGDARDGRETLELTRSLRPEVVLLDGAIIGLDAISVVEGIGTSSPETAVIVLVDGADLDLMRRLMRAGARDCLVKPLAGDDLLNAVNSVHEALLKQRDAIGPNADASSLTRGKIIAVYSPQGGAGKSVLASNLAVAMAKAAGAKDHSGRVALVDLNLQFGDVDLMLNLSPENTIAGLASKGNVGVDPELVEQYLTVHQESGLRILVAPSSPQHAESITVYTIEQVLEALRQSYQYVIVDTPSQLQDTTLAALDAATTILLLTTLDLLALHKTRTALEMLRQLYPAEKIQVVLNRANSEVGISLAEVEQVLGVPMRAQIPSEGRVVVTSVNEGKPFVLYNPTTVIARRINELAMELLGREVDRSGEVDAKGGGWLKKMFG